jgi:hypothetical protein
MIIRVINVHVVIYLGGLAEIHYCTGSFIPVEKTVESSVICVSLRGDIMPNPDNRNIMTTAYAGKTVYAFNHAINARHRCDIYRCTGKILHVDDNECRPAGVWKKKSHTLISLLMPV